jgi:Mu-like prophage FluMu N-terminal domain
MMTGIRVTSRTHGFRRAGIAHPGTPVIHAIDFFNEAQIELLEKEPQLVVDWVEVDDEDKSKVTVIGKDKAKAKGKPAAKTE